MPTKSNVTFTQEEAEQLMRAIRYALTHLEFCTTHNGYCLACEPEVEEAYKILLVKKVNFICKR